VREVIHVSRKYLTIVIVLGLCIVITIFMAFPRGGSAAGAGYDPWVDIDNNGSVNILDISRVARAFGSSGDPTKPMLVESYQWTENVTSFFLNFTENLNMTISTVGYRYVAVGIYAQSADSHQFELFLGQKIAGKYVYTTVQTPTSDSTIHVIKPTWYENIHPAVSFLFYEVAFSELVLCINNISTGQILKGSIAYYLCT
jgi:hypothetical protein